MEQVPNLYDQLVGGYWKRQQGLEDMRQKNLNFEQDYARDEMRIPEEVAKSKLATMTAEADAGLLPMKTAVQEQDYDNEYKFNVLRDMKAVLSAQDMDEKERDNLLQTGILKMKGLKRPPTLADSEKVANTQYIIQAMKQNPQGALAKLDAQMSALASTFKSRNAEDLARTRGDIQHTNTLLKGQMDQKIASMRASFGEQNPKEWKHYAQVQLRQAEKQFGLDSPQANAWREESKMAAYFGGILRSENQGTQKFVDTSGDTPSLKNKPASKPLPTPKAVGGGGMGQRGSVSVSGDSGLVAGALAELERRKQQGNK